MLRSLERINRYQQGDLTVLKTDPWLMHLALAEEVHFNLERVDSIEELRRNLVLDYVARTLSILEGLDLPEAETHLLEEVLIWAEVAKGGMLHQRREWLKKGYNLYVHNIGSAQIYQAEMSQLPTGVDSRLISTLICTHGLIGQYIRGEVPLEKNRPLTDLVSQKITDSESLYRTLVNLNHCIIAGVSPELWKAIQKETQAVIRMITHGNYEQEYSLTVRLKKLRGLSIQNGEDFSKEVERVLKDSRVVDAFSQILAGTDLWFVEAALYDLSFEEFVKVFLLIYKAIDLSQVRHISFEKLMKGLYYQHEGRKRINIYKKRVIEKYLAGLSIPGILEGITNPSPHLEHKIEMNEAADTVFFDFQFSAAGAKLIDFCTEAEKADLLYERAIVLLFDLFELRRDKYDRFLEEEKYLVTMNRGVDYKKIILDYVTGQEIVDIGPGGGILLDLIELNYPDKKVTGIDISQNVLDALERKKKTEGRKWQVIYGDALNLSEYLKPGSVDTVIFCSIIHELYSYLEFEGRSFNIKTIAAALQSAFTVLAPGGRIIIRDGIMTDPVDQKRIIKFLSADGVKFLTRYASDFKGRKIEYRLIGLNEVLMPVNDAMEFLYTYTWGEKSYAHEINEQFGYFTPGTYRAFIEETLGPTARIIECRHFLQEGYTTALSSKIEFFDERHIPVPLPDSTCLIVVEKRQK